MKVIYKDIAETLIDIISNAELNNRGVKEVFLTLSEANELKRSLTLYTPSYVGDSFYFMGVLMKVVSKF